MKSSGLTVMLEPQERLALDRVAAEEQRTLSSTARLAIRAWLRERGRLERGEGEEKA